MVELLLFSFRVPNSRLKNKKESLRAINSMGALLFFSISSYKRKFDKWKKFLKYYSLNVNEPLEIDTSP